ncbi:MAG: AAA family ATPase, partial [Prevotellaceae bacterium]|nr:AAA family ATPase [Prevotellaceae bacterium]
MENNEFAFDFAQYTKRNLFITGKAGTGKTTFLRHLKSSAHKQMAVVAPTGVAAVNAGGTTIHSFFQLPFTPFIPTAEGRKDLIAKIKMQEHRRNVLRELELLVIDEISMVRADLLDSIDCVLRHFRYRNNELFGGVQVIYIGDMFQLSPVATDEEWRMLSQYYPSPYFFHSQAVAQQPPLYIEFEKIYRQTNASFIKVLNEIRNDCLSAESLRLLEERYNPLFIPPVDDSYITLTTHNYKADRINAEELAKINGKTYRFEAKITGDYPEKSYPTEKELELKIGAKVMFLRNDTEQPRRYFNGKIGVVEKIEENAIAVRSIDDRELIKIEQTAWENIRYSSNAKTRQIEEEMLGSFIQYPLRLAWAITIHKSQGLTFDKAVIDAGDAFAAGQVYVALSRCRSLEGLVLLSKINPQSIHNNRQIVEHERNKVPVDVLEGELDNSRKFYRSHILQTLFNFGALHEQAKQLLKEIKTVETSFNDETTPFLENIREQLQNIDDIAVKFRQQLQSIFSGNPLDEDFLQSRVSAANGFFAGKIDNLIETLRQSPASTDSRTNAAVYNTGIQTLFSDLALKKHI